SLAPAAPSFAFTTASVLVENFGVRIAVLSCYLDEGNRHDIVECRGVHCHFLRRALRWGRRIRQCRGTPCPEDVWRRGGGRRMGAKLQARDLDASALGHCRLCRGCCRMARWLGSLVAGRRVTVRTCRPRYTRGYHAHQPAWLPGLRAG